MAKQLRAGGWSMNGRTGVLILIACVFATSANAVDSAIVNLRGFKFEMGLVKESKRAKLTPSYLRQIEIVEQANLPPEVMTFFRGIPIVINPKLEISKGEARKLEGQQIVILADEKLPSDRPILLHELLHGYFALKLRGRTPIIPKTFYATHDAKYYPKDYYEAHFLENPNEFFAVMSSIYLIGKIDQPPYDCKMLAKHHPEFVEFLSAQFGPHECK